MKNLDLNAMGVVEMEKNEKSNVNGGTNLPAQFENWDNLTNTYDGLELTETQMHLLLIMLGRG